MSYIEIKHDTYTVEIEEPTVYVDNQARGRSGHMSHAMAEFAPGCFIEFNSNCSKNRWDGHSPYGWIEYRISRDSGKTYSEIKKLPYSVECFEDGMHMISVEKAIACNDGSIVAICLRNIGTTMECCEPWSTPMVVRSLDEGKTWTEAVELCPYPGRPYDALYRDGVIYVLHLCHEEFLGTSEEHVYRLYRSTDNGKTFEEYSTLPIDPIRRGYGSILFDAEGKLHAYAYNEAAELDMDHAVSEDCGRTWTLLPPCHVAKGIRNPQTALIDGVYILHGRAADVKGFVLYTSLTPSNWDEGVFIVEKHGAYAYYSNNLNLTDEKGNFLLIQYSDTYEDAGKVNDMHVRVRVKK